jgi:TPR repeat protein
MPDGSIRPRTDELRDRYRWGLDRFVQEARTLARFDHPNIVRVLSVFEVNDTAYMVMRFEKGGTLAALLDRRGTLNEDELIRVLLPIMDGLVLVHDAGFIHRDIKPDNIHIGDDGTPVLLDFGSARQSLGNSHTLTILVAPGYAPFEQYYSDSSSQGPWTDIYGLGATCYRAIAGRPPLDAVSRSKGILGSTQEVMVPASIVGAGRYSGALLAAVDHALKFAEKDRPQTLAQWRQELAGERVAPPPTALAGARAAARGVTTLAPETIRADDAGPPLAGANPSRPRQWSATPVAPSRATPAPTPPVRGLRMGAMIVATVAAIAVGVYVANRLLNHDTLSRVEGLERQLGEQRRAEADRNAMQKADEAARAQREQDRLAEEKRAEAERVAKEKADQDARVRREQEQAKVKADDQKRRDDAAAKRPPTLRAAPNASPPPAASANAPNIVLPTVGAPEAVRPIVPEPPKVSAPPTPAEQLAEADKAAKEGRLSEASDTFRRLAEAGNAIAQERLGDAYADGRGVTRDYPVAEKWYEKAALQGNTYAQRKLGAMYATGTGVTSNPFMAYVWYGTAARLGSDPAKQERDKYRALLQPAEREQADRLIESKATAIPTDRK